MTMQKRHLKIHANKKEKSFLFILHENKYYEQIYDIVRDVVGLHPKVCYTCINKPYDHVIDELRTNNINTNSFYFVDILSSHYTGHDDIKNCAFLMEPIKLDDIYGVVSNAVIHKKCSAVIVDTMSNLLAHDSNFSIVKFTHNLISDNTHKNTRKIFIVVKEKGLMEQEVDSLINDISMFADRVIDFAS